MVAVSIPIFTAQLEKARRATDAANIRAGYAEVVAEVLGADPAIATGATFYLMEDGSVEKVTEKPTSGAYLCKGSAAAADKVTIGGAGVLEWASGAAIVYTYTAGTGMSDSTVVASVAKK